MDALLEYVRGAADGEVFVGLFATPGSRALYRGVGFERHDALAGMCRLVS